MKLRPFAVAALLCLSLAPLDAKTINRRLAAAQTERPAPASVLKSMEKTLRENGHALIGRSWHRLTSWRAEGCTVTYVITDEGGDARLPSDESSVDLKKHSRMKFRVDLSTLDPQGVEVRPYRGIDGGSVTYRTQDEQKHILYELDYPAITDQRSRGWFYLKDRESLDQTATLLREAIAMCRK